MRVARKPRDDLGVVSFVAEIGEMLDEALYAEWLRLARKRGEAGKVYVTSLPLEVIAREAKRAWEAGL